ncbi:hypothetical protein NCS57_00406600 [Fusarium keratoplasticum]|uniref:Uncharacterized protein n=1 Tax=Fusarium keratoplasticum TaxID=1328300 RepID=A0ACC0R5A2_9HYPO|nr:hypothetical protein NCS57_00406600 [Fusarium keratoplasticum]KAI8675069.1 hypothetical protein NCS57_00406600 [Fusarium keratoplasticum]KAI8681526.1 hypothetical protein NCS55_00404400 [Fusarium keratoplasticum]
MSNDEILTDDYVADLLAQEASDCSLKYSAMGMEAYRENKKPANMLKPNTRFLRHIIKDTDNHNKALLAKEAAESRARLKDLERAKEIERRKTNPSTHDIRRRQMGDIHAILGGKKRRRSDGDAGPSSSKDSKKRESEHKSRRERDSKDKDLFKDQRDDRRHHGRLSREDRHSKTDDGESRSERSRREHKRRERSRSRGSEEEERHRHSRRRKDRSRSPTRRRRSRSPRETKSRHRHRSPLNTTNDTRKQKDEKEDSDAGEDLFGPAPPPKYRGRGTIGGSSGIDRRFSENYDPKKDIQMDDDEGGGNWDDAVEAFRNRQKLRQNQEQRPSTVEFTNDKVPRAGNVDEKSAESVRWSKAGEKREWDLGKEDEAEGVSSGGL